MSQIARPGLPPFHEDLYVQFDQLVTFATVPESLLRRIAELLVREGGAPLWFAEIDYTKWSGKTKDLRFVSPRLGDALLMDDHRAYVHPGQGQWWIEMPLFGSPYDESDGELAVAGQRIRKKLLI
ncbi:hypothetical protein [Stenotrophomonas sp. SY1]|uniref:hypothetical protein n=1 Tax=Stenotrophomonas sp. SY1 TaxID=477235 RepID=UPI001E345F52|nr:hypothetical protein [Stenotrophomonas sp. SY1]MCD9087705.1 hypothetical protein [Stenotrophomonas sp. SY1]